MNKRILNNALYLSMICLLYLGCNGQTFSKDKFIFDSKLNSFFKAITKADTIYFENNKNSIDTFILTKLDSTIVNPNQNFCLPCPMAVKTVFRNYKEYPINYWSQPKVENGNTNYEIRDEEALISISKSPQNDSTMVHMSFKNFRCQIQFSLGKSIDDTLLIGNNFFSNYYKLNTYAKSLVINDEDVELIFVTLNDGIIAYKEKSGILRKRIF
jgi:hypothetical protein